VAGAPDRERGGGAEESPAPQHHPAARGGRDLQPAVPGHGARQGASSSSSSSSSSGLSLC